MVPRVQSLGGGPGDRNTQHSKMSTQTQTTNVLELPAVQALASVLLVVSVAVVVVCGVYFWFASGKPSALDELEVVQDDKVEITTGFSIAGLFGVAGAFGAAIVLGVPPLLKEDPPETPKSGQDLINLYKNLPRDAVIHCDFDVAGVFEECQVLSKGLNLIGRPKKDPQKVIEDTLGSNRNIAHCCTDPVTKTTIFASKAIVLASPKSVSQAEPHECLKACKAGLLNEKIIRNELYALLAAKNVESCQFVNSGDPRAFRVNYAFECGIGAGEKLYCGGVEAKTLDSVKLPNLYRAILDVSHYKMAYIQQNQKAKSTDPDKLNILVVRNSKHGTEAIEPLTKVLERVKALA